ncbi:DUF4255 domain-containing protein [Aquiflexum sp.]|uniref:DUF4255 domain-containing protein n=1 Tax=Aquiflexum sp. TaxID=1872584 RepID=UPI003593B2E9
MNEHFGSVEPEVVLGNLSLIDSYNDDLSTNISDRVVLSVVNIQQESILRNNPANRQIFDNSGLPRGVARHPGIFLNIFLLIGANKSEYVMGLQRISQVLSFFQRNPIFTTAQIPSLPDFSLDKIIFDLHSTSFEELNQLWGIMGGKYIPSVIYKMRLAYIDNVEEGSEIPLVKSIDTSFNNKSR